MGPLTDKLFGTKQKDPKELVREWKAKLRKEERGIDRQVRDIKMEEAKIKKSIKECAKRNDVESAKILAKEVVQSRRATERLLTSKAQLHSVSMQLQQQAASQRVMGGLQKSTEIMTMMNSLMRIPEISATMMAMEKEMMKAGVVDEMLEDAMEEMDDVDELDELAEEEVDKVLMDVAGTTLSQIGPIATGTLPVHEEPEPVATDDLTSQLKALKS